MFKNPLASLLAILSFLTCFQTASARVISDPAIGYSIEIPDDWRDIPQPDFDAAMKAALQTSAVRMIRGFEPASHTQNFQYPYIVIQTTPYPSGTHMTSVNESFLKGVIQGITGTAQTDLKKGLTPKAASLITSVDKPVASYFTSPPGIVADMNVEAGAIKFHAHCIGLVGQDRCVYVNFYCPADDTASLQSVVDAVAPTFRQDPSQQVAFSERGEFFSGALSGAKVGAITGGICGGLFVLLRALKKKRPPSQPFPT